MTEPTLTYNTSDGQRFDDMEAAQEHQRLLNKLDRFMNAENIPERARAKTVRRILAWMDFHAQTSG